MDGHFRRSGDRSCTYRASHNIAIRLVTTLLKPATRCCSDDDTTNAPVMIHLLQSLPGSSYKAQPSSSTKEVTALLNPATRYCSGDDSTNVSVMTLLLQVLPSNSCKAWQLLRGPAQQLRQGGQRSAQPATR